MDPQSGLTLVGNFILGGISVFAVGLMGWAIRELKRVQDARVADQKAFTTELTGFSTRFQEAQASTVSAIDRLTAAENQQTDALKNNTAALSDCKGTMETMRQTIDSVVRDAVRRPRTTSGQFPARPPEKE